MIIYVGDKLIATSLSRGTRTRLLLDYYLKKVNISPNDINGYEREEFTHLSVAAVASGDVDCGLGGYDYSNIGKIVIVN